MMLFSNPKEGRICFKKTQSVHFYADTIQWNDWIVIISFTELQHKEVYESGYGCLNEYIIFKNQANEKHL